MKLIYLNFFFLPLFFLACASTTSLYYLPNPIPAEVKRNPMEIEVMYDGPGRPYDVLGLIDYFRYQPGYSDPTLADIIFDLRAKGSEVGGDALIIRHTNSKDRTINLTAEVIRYRE